MQFTTSFTTSFTMQSWNVLLYPEDKWVHLSAVINMCMCVRVHFVFKKNYSPCWCVYVKRQYHYLFINTQQFFLVFTFFIFVVLPVKKRTSTSTHVWMWINHGESASLFSRLFGDLVALCKHSPEEAGYSLQQKVCWLFGAALFITCSMLQPVFTGPAEQGEERHR